MYFKAISTRVACLLFLASLCANAFATSASVAVGGGTLFYTETTTTGNCYNGGLTTYTQYRKAHVESPQFGSKAENSISSSLIDSDKKFAFVTDF